MPKWKSHVVKKETTADGRITPGITAWEPLDDAAKASDLSDKAVDHLIYKRSSPFEKQELKKKIQERMRKDAESRMHL